MAFTTTTITMIFFLSLTSLFFYLHRQRYSLTRNLIYSSLFFMILSFISLTSGVLLFTIWEASAIRIIGAADGPSTIFVGNKFSKDMSWYFALPQILIATIFSSLVFTFFKRVNLSFLKTLIYSLLSIFGISILTLMLIPTIVSLTGFTYFWLIFYFHTEF